MITNRSAAWVAAVVSVVLSFLYFGRNLGAKMGIIDDHFHFSRGVLSDVSRVFWNFVEAEEFRSFGNSPRFRPVYWLISDLQLSIWGMEAPAWYLVNILIFAFFAFAVFHIVSTHLGPKWAIPFTLLVVGQFYFAHIYTRLGTAESWAMLGLTIYALGFSSLWRKLAAPLAAGGDWKEWLAMVCGAILAIGSKENFAAMGILVCACLCLVGYHRRITKHAIVGSLLILGCNAYQVLHILLTLRGQGVDFYQNDAAAASRLTKVLQEAFSGYGLLISSAAILFAAALTYGLFVGGKAGLARLARRERAPESATLAALLATVVLYTLFLFNLYIYNGVFHHNGRYAFPSVLAAQTLGLLIAKWLWDRRPAFLAGRGAGAVRVFYVLLIAGLTLSVARVARYSMRISGENVHATRLFQAKLAEMVEEIRKHPEAVIVLSSHDAWDYEPIQGSVPAYLRYHGVGNKMMVRTNYAPATAEEDPMIRWVKEENRKLEREGGRGFVPYDGRDDANCLVIDFSGTTEAGKSRNLGRIFRLGNYPY